MGVQVTVVACTNRLAILRKFTSILTHDHEYLN